MIAIRSDDVCAPVTRRRLATVLALLAAGITAVPAAAQLSSASTAALGMGDNYTAAARGYSAIAWNPAGLALRGNPGMSFTALTLRGIAGLDPITLSDLVEYEDRLVPDLIKQAWLTRVENRGGQSGMAGFDSNWLALSVGPFGLQVSTSARTAANISPGIAELIMFGNVAADGEPRTISLSGSTLDVTGYTTVGASWGHALTIGGLTRLALGVTAKYTVGHVVARGIESTGTATADPLMIQMQFPILHSGMGGDEDDEFEPNSGSGFGLDLGVGYELGPWTFAGTVQNVINTFEWDASLLRFRPGELLFDADSREASFDEVPLDQAPAALRALVGDLEFKPILAAGAQFQPTDQLRVTADLRTGSADGLVVQPSSHAGAGIEYRLLGFLPVRAGAALISYGADRSGFQIGGGIGIDVLGFSLGASALRRDTDLGVDNVVQFTFLGRGQ